MDVESLIRQHVRSTSARLMGAPERQDHAARGNDETS